jgi:hypothetical protein
MAVAPQPDAMNGDHDAGNAGSAPRPHLRLLMRPGPTGTLGRFAHDARPMRSGRTRSARSSPTGWDTGGRGEAAPAWPGPSRTGSAGPSQASLSRETLRWVDSAFRLTQ